MYTLIRFLIKFKFYDRALEILTSIDLEDNNFKLLLSCIYYEMVFFNRDNAQVAKGFMRKSADLVREILRVEKNNLFASNICACLMAERGRFSEGLFIVNKISESLKSGHFCFYNLALMEFLKGNFEKAATIFESQKSSLELKKKDLYGIVLTKTKNFKEAENYWKFKFMRNPTIFSQYNLSAFHHELSNYFFRKTEKRLKRLKKLKEFLNFSLFCFKKIDRSIGSEVFK